MSLGKFLDPKNDFCFKRIFGTERHQNVLIHFINDILELESGSAIREVHFLKTSQDPEIASKKQSLVDVLCRDEQGKNYIIEMQVARTAGFEKRAQFYAARAYSRQLDKGEKYHELKAVIFVAITDFIMFPEKSDCYSTHEILDKKNHTRDLKDFSFVFLELPKFNKAIDELENRLDKWAYFFKSAEKTEEKDLVKIVGTDQVIYDAYEALNRFSLEEVELNTYEEAEKRERDAEAILDAKLMEGRAKGKEEGIVEGKVEGRIEGVNVTVQAITLLRLGYSIDAVYKETGLDKNTLQILQDSFSQEEELSCSTRNDSKI